MNQGATWGKWDLHIHTPASYQWNGKRLRDATTEDGKPLATIDLPMPAPVYFAGRRLPASYANFYIANGIVLVPVFNDPNDRVALDIFVDIFPDREIVGIYCGDLVWGFGAIHCMTQQQPAPTVKATKRTARPPRDPRP